MVKRSRIEMTKEEADLIDKWIIVLLSVNNNEPIRGRIRFIKEFFLYSVRYNKKLFKISEFYPYHFGPYSTRFAARVNYLKSMGYVTAEFSGQDWQYFLTEIGLEKKNKVFNNISSKTLEIIKNIKEKNRKLNLKELLKEIYFDYPEFTSRTIIKSDILEIKIKLEDLKVIDDGPGFVAPILPEDQEIVLKEKAARKFLELISD